MGNLNNKDLLFFYLTTTFYLIASIYWIEPSEWGFVLSKKINLSDFNFFYYESLKDFSAINYISSFFITIGVPVKILNFFLYIIINFISVIAILCISKIFFKSNIYLLTPLLLLFINFDNSHGYDVVYPNNYWVFGQLGNYIFLLSIYFFFEKKYNLGILTLIILALVHFVWFIGALIFLIIKFFLESLEGQKYLNYILFLSIFILSTIFLIKLNCNFFKIEFCNFYINSNYFNDFTLDGHNKKLFEKNYSIYNLIHFFRTEILLLLIFIIIKKDHKINLFIKTSIFFTILVIFLKIYETIDYRLYLLDHLGVKELYIRFIPERFFNLNTYVLYILLIGKSLEYLITKKSNLFLLILLLIVVYSGFFTEFNFEKKKTITHYLIICFIFVYFINSYNFNSIIKVISLNKKLIFIDRNFTKIFFAIIIFISIKLISTNDYYKFQDNVLSYINNYENKNKIIFLSSNIHLDRFNPMLETSLEQVIPNSNILINDNLIYCSDRNLSWRDWYNNINMCLSKKTKKEWSAIANVLGDYFLIIEKRYNVELKLLKEDEYYRLYSYK